MFTTWLLEQAIRTMLVHHCRNDRIFIRQGQVLDFETKPNYSVRVRTTDSGGLNFVKQLTLNVTNVNEPVVLTRANASVTGNVLNASDQHWNLVGSGVGSGYVVGFVGYGYQEREWNLELGIYTDGGDVEAKWSRYRQMMEPMSRAQRLT